MTEERPTPAERWDSADAGLYELLGGVLPTRTASRPTGAQRKLRLLVCAAARFAWDYLMDERLREAVVTAERFADGLAGPEAVAQARGVANRSAAAARRDWAALEEEYVRRATPGWLAGGGRPPPVGSDAHRVHRIQFAAEVAAAATHTRLSADVADTLHAVRNLTVSPEDARRSYAPLPDRSRVGTGPPGVMVPVLRDLFTNPFRPVVWDERWASAAARGLADAMTEGGGFDRLPVLADALEEAGCDNAGVLAHCRADRPHYRGCWVVDLVRGVHWSPKLETK